MRLDLKHFSKCSGDFVIVAGIDVGSITAKCVLLRDSKLLAYQIVRVSPNLGETAIELFNNVLTKAGTRKDDVQGIVATGYGRNKVKFADRTVTEISCHAKGALYFIPTTRTVIDIGGQDSKVISISESFGFCYERQMCRLEDF